MATGTSDDERDDDLTNDTEPTGDEADAADETVDEADALDEVESGDDAAADKELNSSGGASSKRSKRDPKPAKGSGAAKVDAATSAKGATGSKPEAKPKKAKPNNSGNGERRGLSKFFHEVLIELKKVVTPTRTELWRYVGVVVGFVLIMMILVMLFDWIFGFGSSWVFGNGQDLIPADWFQGGNPGETPMPTEPALPAEPATP